MKYLSTICLLLALTSISSASEVINIRPGNIASIALGEEVWTIGCELENAPDGVINLSLGSGIAIAAGEESIAVSCN